MRGYGASIPIWHSARNKIRAGLSHTLVYQFVVGKEHAHLNEGPWLKHDFVYEPDEGKDPPPGTNFNPTDGATEGVHTLAGGPTIGNRRTAIDWLYGESDGTLPKPTAVKPWNTLAPRDTERLNWEASGTESETPGWIYHRWGNHSDFTRSHHHILMYDPAEKETIYYPKVVVGNTDKTTVSSSTAITNVPSGTQTGEFPVTVAFSEVQEIADFTVNRVTFAGVNPRSDAQVPPTRSDIIVPGASVSIFVVHDVSDVGVAAFQTSLTAALAAADPPWTVREMAYAGGAEIASLKPHGKATRYTVTLSPPLGVKGDIALQIPADAVLDVLGNGHAASETVMVSVDTKTRTSSGIIKMPGQRRRLADLAMTGKSRSLLRQLAHRVIRMVR